MTKKVKNKKHKTEKYFFEPNIPSNLHSVNFDKLIEKVKKLLLRHQLSNHK